MNIIGSVLLDLLQAVFCQTRRAVKEVIHEFMPEALPRHLKAPLHLFQCVSSLLFLLIASLPPAPSSSPRPTLTRLSLHSLSKLSPSIQMIRLCNTMHTHAHMMMIMWRLVLMSWIQISLRDWKVPFSMPIVCSTCIRICI
jgi:hypothetical protein